MTSNRTKKLGTALHSALLTCALSGSTAMAQPNLNNGDAIKFLEFYVEVLEHMNPDLEFRNPDRFALFNEEHTETPQTLVAAYNEWVDTNRPTAVRARPRIFRCVNNKAACDLYLDYAAHRINMASENTITATKAYSAMLGILNPSISLPDPSRFAGRREFGNATAAEVLIRYRDAVQLRTPGAMLPAVRNPDKTFENFSIAERLTEFVALSRRAYPNVRFIDSDTFFRENQSVADRWYRLRREYVREMRRRNPNLALPDAILPQAGSRRTTSSSPSISAPATVEPTEPQPTPSAPTPAPAPAPRPTATGSALWTQYRDAFNANRPLPIPDYSHAGYDNSNSALPDLSGWRVFRVEDFGARANDNRSDLSAVRDAINAASRHANSNRRSGAVVEFGSGEYLLSDGGRNPDRNLIDVVASRVALRGNGSEGSDRTVLNFPDHPALTRFGDNALIALGRRESERPGTVVADDAPKGSFTLRVANTSRLNVGDYVVIELDDRDATNDGYLWGGYRREGQMTHRNVVNGSYVVEYHRISAINGQVLEFDAPLISDVEADYNILVQRMDFFDNVGIMNLELRGNFNRDFVHHRSSLDNSGFIGVSMTNTANSWVDDVRMEDVNVGVSLNRSANATVRELVITGRRAHYGVSINQSSRTLVTNSQDRTNGGMQHPFSVSHRANGTVFYCNSWPSQTGFDTHGAQPRATLFDNNRGGFLGPNGGISGTSASYPAHIDSLVIWNFADQSNATFGFDNSRSWTKRNFEWWSSTGARQKLVNPHIVGWSGENRPRHVVDTVATLESDGTRFSAIPSLFEAQLTLRKGALPDYVSRDPQACIATD